MPRPKSSKPAADRHREKNAADNLRKRQQSEDGRDIGTPPPVKNQKRRKKCERSFLQFCLTYLLNRFPLPFSPDHLLVIAKLEQCVLRGGQFALAMPRGSGKSSLSEAVAMWATCYGHCRFVVLVGASEDHAEQMLDSIKVEFETNELLAEDFPKVIYPILKLENIAHRAAGQTCGGQPTNIHWSNKKIVLPTIKGSKSSGTVVKIAGITGRIRGQKHTTADGESIRPDLVVIDDPQTDESSASATQNDKRERTLAGAILGLAGPGKLISAIMPCTVIENGDMADRILDRQRHPEWNGERMQLVYEFPTNKALWEKYATIREDSLRAGAGIGPATEFYKANKAEMDAGARVAWEARFRPDEASAIQHAMNLLYQDERSFWSEYQNKPLQPRASDDRREMTADEIAKKLAGIPAGRVPLEATRLTGFVDVQGNILFYVVCAWDERFSGVVLDYGTWPRQTRGYFHKSDANPNFASQYPKHSQEAAIYAALTDLTDQLLGRGYRRHGSEELVRVERLMIDANWGKSTDVVYQFIRQSRWSTMLLPSHGQGFTAARKPMAEWGPRTGDKPGLNWRIVAPASGGNRKQRHVVYDTNWWKSFVMSRLATPIGSPGCLALGGDRASDHIMFADHLTSEYSVTTDGRGRKLEEWALKADRPDNDWWDCLIGATVCGSIAGVPWEAGSSAPGSAPPKTEAKAKPLTFAEQRARLDAAKAGAAGAGGKDGAGNKSTACPPERGKNAAPVAAGETPNESATPAPSPSSPAPTPPPNLGPPPVAEPKKLSYAEQRAKLDRERGRRR
jgi:hypothetical protein